MTVPTVKELTKKSTRPLPTSLCSRKEDKNRITMENITKFIVAKFVLVLLVSTTTARSIFDVTKEGAKIEADINQPLTRSWNKACATTIPSKVLIPKGIFLLSPVTLEGPCKAAIEVEVQGTLKALTNSKVTKDGSWVTFQRIEHFTLSGGGTFDGQGDKVWGTCGNNFCKQLPINIRFDFIINGFVQNIKSLNSKQFHINVLGCNELTFQRVNIIAPADSHNTDGIHIGRSNGIKIIDSDIRTGDDCVSIGDGSKNISITNVKCGPGHGISVGSLGKFEKEEPVFGISVRNCTLTNTDNGVRIKTWPASTVNPASMIHFEDINMINVSNPVLIDQVYCPWNQCNAKVPSRVKLSNISFKRIRGTSATPVAMKLVCSSGTPCQGVEVADIQLKYIGKGPAISECENVKPIISGAVNPPACSSKA
ncbi:exopolygalacturonase-like [Mangifera indica]|uniref:exopolygalacturonase-like n=1 Tax=Mangifera indica TaxID=29780 RepID=UPI001CF93070|nr:exopolygalacturonase-like [Mangifera indica]